MAVVIPSVTLTYPGNNNVPAASNIGQRASAWVPIKSITRESSPRHHQRAQQQHNSHAQPINHALRQVVPERRGHHRRVRVQDTVKVRVG